MSEAVAAPAGSQGEGAPADQQSSALFGMDTGALLDKMGLPNHPDGGGKGKQEPEAKPENKGEGEGGEEYVFEFAGQRYTGKTEAEAKAKAEHAFKVHRGQSSAAQRELARARQQLTQRSAPAAPAAQPQKEVKKEGSAPATAKAEAKGEGGEDGNLLGLSDGDFAAIQRLRAEGKHDLADALLIDKYNSSIKQLRGMSAEEVAKLKAEMREELDALRKPEQERQAQQQQFDSVVNSFHDRGSITDEEGNHLYPELLEDEGLEEVADMWERMVRPVADYPGLPPDFAITPAGVHLAYTNLFWEKYHPLVRAALAAGYDEKGRKATSPTPSAPAATAQARGRMSAPLVMPTPAPRREPNAPRTPDQTFKDMLTSKGEDNLI